MAKKSMKNLHKLEEKYHHQAERAMKKDEKINERLEKKHKKEEKHKSKNPKKKAPGKSKIQKVMHEFKENKLHSGSKKGPKVKSRKQAVAIALSEARKAGAKLPKKKK